MNVNTKNRQQKTPMTFDIKELKILPATNKVTKQSNNRVSSNLRAAAADATDNNI